MSSHLDNVVDILKDNMDIVIIEFVLMFSGFFIYSEFIVNNARNSLYVEYVLFLVLIISDLTLIMVALWLFTLDNLDNS